MKNEKKLVWLSVDELYPNPNNPRKELGDLIELTESIKEHGVLQNLTVIPGHWLSEEEYSAVSDQYDVAPTDGLKEMLAKQWSPHGYTILIGHRRHQAAKLAGVGLVPCEIKEEMELSSQVSIMIVENSHRNALTVTEEANGIQMMLDLGETMEGVAKKNGFSKTTVRHRVNIAKLDQSVLGEKAHDDSFQLTFTDLYELEKIKDIEKRNEILKKAGSSKDIVWRVDSALQEEKRVANAEIIAKQLETIGITEAPKSVTNDVYSNKWLLVKDFDLDKEPMEDMEISREEDLPMYYYRHYRYVRVVQQNKASTDDAQTERKKLEARRKMVQDRVKELHARGRDFVLGIISGKVAPLKDEEMMHKAIWKVLVDNSAFLTEYKMWQFLSGKNKNQCTEAEKDEYMEKMEKLSVLQQMMVFLQCVLSEKSSLLNYQNVFLKNDAQVILNGYNVLKPYGWSFEEDELALLEGTHELYLEQETQVEATEKQAEAEETKG